MRNKLFIVETISGGQKKSLQVEARSKTEALQKARNGAEGAILKITEGVYKTEGAFGKLRLLFKTKIKQEPLIAAIRQASVMAKAGIPFTIILQEAAETAEDKALSNMFLSVLADVNAGASLSTALKKFDYELPKTVPAMVELGEKTGAMAESLERLADILEQSADNKAKIKKALRYPTFVSIAMIAAFVVMVMGIIPKFKTVFDRFKAELPLPTRILLELESFLSSYATLVAIAIFCIWFVYKRAYSKNDAFRLKADTITLKAPIAGEMVRLGSISGFTNVFKELIKAGIPITEALEIAAKGVDNSKIKSSVMQTISSVQKGSPFAFSLKEAKLYDGAALKMISAGEQSGALYEMLDKTALYYQKKFETKMDKLTSSIEPILIAFIAGFVLLLALGVFMPMWDMAKAVK